MKRSFGKYPAGADAFDRSRNKIRRERSSSIDVKSRGSYVPNYPRSTSLERPSSFGQSGRASYTRVSSSLAPDVKRVIKDTRRLHEKAYRAKRIEELLDFLAQNNYPVNPAFKAIPPSKKEYEGVFQYLFNFWDEKFKVTKLEEDAPKQLKQLGYPFTINKTVFMCMTSQNWPQVLGVLIWLLDMNKFATNFDDDALFQSDEEHANEYQIFFQYICQGYQNNPETDREKDEEVFTNLLKSRDVYDKKEAWENELQDYKQQLEDIEIAMKRHSDLEKQCEHLKENVKKYEVYFSEMDTHIALKEKHVNNLQEDFNKRAEELSVLEEQIKERQAVYDAQGYDGQMQLNYIDTQKKELGAKLDEKCNELKKAQQQLGETEIQKCIFRDKEVADVEQFNEMYNSMIQTKDNAVSYVENLPIPKVKALFREIKLDLPIPQYEMKANQRDYNTWLSTVIPNLMEVRKKVESKLAIMKSFSSNQNKKLEELQLKTSEAISKKGLLKAQLSQKENEIYSRKQQEVSEAASMAHHSEELSQQLQKLRIEKSAALKSREDLMAKLKEKEIFIEKQEKEMLEFSNESQTVLDEFERAIQSTKDLIIKCKKEAIAKTMVLKKLALSLEE